MFQNSYENRDIMILWRDPKPEQNNLLTEYEHTLRWAIDYINAHQLSEHEQCRIEHLLELLDKI